MAVAAGTGGLASGSSGTVVAAAAQQQARAKAAVARTYRSAARTRASHRSATRGAARTTSTAPQSAVAMLDPTLSQPQPGDSAATRAARVRLGIAQRQYEVANQDYDHAAQTVHDLGVRLVAARAAAAKAHNAATQAQASLIAQVQHQYLASSEVLDPIQALLTGEGAGLLDRIELSNQISNVQADLLQTAQRLQKNAQVAEQAIARTEAQATAARTAAAGAQARAATALAAATDSLTALEATDSFRSGSYAGSGADGIGPAAAALRARALASGAATAATIPAGAAPATTIALAARALLNQAAGRGPRPLSAGPAFTVTHGAPVDEQAVMGLPQLGGTTGYGGATGSTSNVRSLTPFTGAVPAAPGVLSYPAGYTPLRAEVAVDQALAVLGTPYVWDAAGPSSFDCSGLTMWAWSHAGVPLNHYTGDQVNEGARVTPNQLLPGDLVLFGSDLHHVGMYLGEGYMIDAPDTGDVVKVQLVADDGDFAVAVRP